MFKGIITIIICASALIVLLPDSNLLTMMLNSQFLGGLILPVLLIFMALISANKRIMGEYAAGNFTKIIL